MYRSQLHLTMIVVIVMVCGLAATSAPAETITVEFEFSPQELSVKQGDRDSTPLMPGCTPMMRVGGPALPCRAEQVVLPEGTRAVGLTLRSLTSVRVPFGEIRPVQPPAILGPIGSAKPTLVHVAPDPAIYEGQSLYPTNLAEFRGTGHMRDLAVASFELRPMQYDPTTGELILHTRLAVDLELEPDLEVRRTTSQPSEMDRLTHKIATETMHGALTPAQTWQDGVARSYEAGNYQYLIVTEEAQLPAYEAYAAWKTAKGVPATTATVEWIDANYSGRDLAEKVRNFVIEATSEWGLSYLLIGGDHHIVPSRISFAFDCGADVHDDENDIPADLYYADHDGDWDANGNDIFGEVDDNIDLYPEILVGRAPSDSLEEAWIAVYKFMIYEKTPPAGDRTMSAFFFAEILWEDPYTDSGIGKDMIDDRHLGPAYDPIEKQYESQGNETVISVQQHLNWGPHLVNHAGHASANLMGCGDEYLNRWAVVNLVNAPHFYVLYSIGCYAAAFDGQSIGENFVVSSDQGGAVAFIGNSRFGWGSPGNPGWGYSETFDSDFFGCLVNEDLNQLGAAVAWPKIARIPFAQDGNVYRWHEYQVNLLGDPEMTVHTAPVTLMTLDAPSVVPLGGATFTARVADAAGPVVGARLCLAGDDVYWVGTSDASGRVQFPAEVATARALTLTASAPNHPSVQRVVVAVGEGPFPVPVGWVGLDGNGGNGDNMFTAGETIEVIVVLENYGGQVCTNLRGSLQGGGEFTRVLSGEVSFGDIPSGASGYNLDRLIFRIDEDCPLGEVFAFDLDLVDDSGGQWTGHLEFGEMSPDIHFDHYTVAEVIGDGDGLLEANEIGSVTVFVRNDGVGFAPPMSGSLSTTDPRLTILAGSSNTSAQLNPGECVALESPFVVRVENSAPTAGYGDFELDFAWAGGSAKESFLLAIGAPGFVDDMESGDGGWTHSGVHDDWHQDTYRSHSGDTSWYCGTVERNYQNNTNAALYSPEFVVPEDPQLSFWAYFDMTIFGADGLLVDVRDGLDWNLIDQLGSGGALDSLLFVSDWAEHRYDLDFLDPGATSQLRFRFVSDDVDTDEGFYIDDVRVFPLADSVIAVPGAGPVAFSLSQAWPNPLSAETRWQMILPRDIDVDLRIFDLRGRQIRTLRSGGMFEGTHTLVWDGRTDRAQPAAAGVYLLQVRVGQERDVRKLVLLR